MIKKELRLHSERVTAQQNTRTISGYASTYESISKDLGGFKEIIKRGAFAGVLRRNPDVIANVNHNDAQILARSNNNLELGEDHHGLYFAFDVPETTYGNDLLINVRAGNVSECSFAFKVGSETWDEAPDGTPLREIHDIEDLYDVALVTTPAYNDTSIALRHLADHKSKHGIDQDTKDRLDRIDF